MRNSTVSPKSRLRRLLGATIVATLTTATVGCVQISHELKYSAVGQAIEDHHEPYYHSPETGRIVVKPKQVSNYCFGEPPFFGHEATCWKRWPEGWIGCPESEEIIIHSKDVVPTETVVPGHPTPAETTTAPQPDPAPQTGTEPAIEIPDTEPSPSDRSMLDGMQSGQRMAALGKPELSTGEATTNEPAVRGPRNRAAASVPVFETVPAVPARPPEVPPLTASMMLPAVPQPTTVARSTDTVAVPSILTINASAVEASISEVPSAEVPSSAEAPSAEAGRSTVAKALPSNRRNARRRIPALEVPESDATPRLASSRLSQVADDLVKALSKLRPQRANRSDTVSRVAEPQASPEIPAAKAPPAQSPVRLTEASVEPTPVTQPPATQVTAKPTRAADIDYTADLRNKAQRSEPMAAEDVTSRESTLSIAERRLARQPIRLGHPGKATTSLRFRTADEQTAPLRTVWPGSEESNSDFQFRPANYRGAPQSQVLFSTSNGK